PVYIHAARCSGYASAGRLPEQLATGPRVLRTYRADDTMNYDHTPSSRTRPISSRSSSVCSLNPTSRRCTCAPWHRNASSSASRRLATVRVGCDAGNTRRQADAWRDDPAAVRSCPDGGHAPNGDRATGRLKAAVSSGHLLSTGGSHCRTARRTRAPSEDSTAGQLCRVRPSVAKSCSTSSSLVSIDGPMWVKMSRSVVSSPACSHRVR
nr:DUF1203 domain-containing protein [Geodermatophilaceae bacterium]